MTTNSTEAQFLAAWLTELLAGDRLAVRVALTEGAGAVKFSAIEHVDGGDMVGIEIVFPASVIRTMLAGKGR